MGLLPEQSSDSLDLAGDAADVRESPLEQIGPHAKGAAVEGSLNTVADFVCNVQSNKDKRPSPQETMSIDAIFQNLMEKSFKEEDIEGIKWVGNHILAANRMRPGMLSPPRLTPLRSVRADQRYNTR
jgi:hypothetical protein